MQKKQQIYINTDFEWADTVVAVNPCEPQKRIEPVICHYFRTTLLFDRFLWNSQTMFIASNSLKPSRRDSAKSSQSEGLNC